MIQHVKKEAFAVIGISVRTTNVAGQSMQDIAALWQRFMAENIAAQIPNKVDDSIYSIYTNYEGDYMQPYDAILGCRVSNLDEIPAGLVGQVFSAATYAIFTAKGDLTKGVVGETWTKIWQANLNRAYTADFEIYGIKAQNPQAAEVAIFVAVK